MKREIRVIGIDDGPFNKFQEKEALVVGTVFRGGEWLDGVLSTKIKVDGTDSTTKLVSMINKCKFKSQLQCIILDGIALGGFNVVDIERLHLETKIPVIVVMRKYPRYEKIKTALKKIRKMNRYKLIEKARKPIKIGKIYAQLIGIEKKEAEKILKITCTRSHLPEPIRTAHIIGAGIIKGESKGDA